MAISRAMPNGPSSVEMTNHLLVTRVRYSCRMMTFILFIVQGARCHVPCASCQVRKISVPRSLFPVPRSLFPIFVCFTRNWRPHMSILHDKLTAQAEDLRARRVALVKEHGENVLGSVTIEQVLGGMRGVPALVCETSSVSADEGLRIRNIPIMELTDITPEETFWLLVTGQRATSEELEEMRNVFAKFYEIPSYVVNTLKAMHPESHPMAMLSAGLLAMEHESEFRKAYDAGVGKDGLWKAIVNDSVRLIASMPGLAAAIYRIRFNKGEVIAPLSDNNDMSANFAHMLGVSNDPSWTDLLRLYLVLHSDHEGGNVS
ncbi:MAG: hypothetical protein EHM43_12690, partial [Ignavibacteriae bacterium]